MQSIHIGEITEERQDTKTVRKCLQQNIKINVLFTITIQLTMFYRTAIKLDFVLLWL